MFDRRTQLALIPGVAGLALGVAAVVADLPALGVGAGACALGAALAVLAAPRSAAAPPTAAPAAGAGAPPGAAPPAEAPPTVIPDVPPATLAPRLAASLAESEPEPGRAPTPAMAVAAEATHDDRPAPAAHPLLDPSGLFNEQYFRVAVETRVAAARRHLRPVAVVLLDVVDGTSLDHPRQVDAAVVVSAIRDTLRDSDTACRLDDGRFGFVLEDTPEDGAIWTIERLRRALADRAADHVRWAGISCYPAHAFSAEEALAKAESALATAREWHQDRIEVAVSE